MTNREEREIARFFGPASKRASAARRGHRKASVLQHARPAVGHKHKKWQPAKCDQCHKCSPFFIPMGPNDDRKLFCSGCAVTRSMVVFA